MIRWSEQNGGGRTPSSSAVADALRNLSQALGQLANALGDGTLSGRSDMSDGRTDPTSVFAEIIPNQD